MERRKRDSSSPLDDFLRQHRRLVLLVSAVAFVIGFVGGSVFMLQQAFAAVGA